MSGENLAMSPSARHQGFLTSRAKPSESADFWSCRLRDSGVPGTGVGSFTVWVWNARPVCGFGDATSGAVACA
jgi:hypothetical protein